jgi:hypothetical protein
VRLLRRLLRRSSGSADLEPWHQGFAGFVDVRYWHKADILVALSNVRFRGYRSRQRPHQPTFGSRSRFPGRFAALTPPPTLLSRICVTCSVMSSASTLEKSRSCTELEDGRSKPIRRKSFRCAIGTPFVTMDRLLKARPTAGAFLLRAKTTAEYVDDS